MSSPEGVSTVRLRRCGSKLNTLFAATRVVRRARASSSEGSVCVVKGPGFCASVDGGGVPGASVVPGVAPDPTWVSGGGDAL